MDITFEDAQFYAVLVVSIVSFYFINCLRYTVSSLHINITYGMLAYLLV